MNLALHVFKKDVRHLRGLLSAWVLLVVLQAGLSGSGLAASAENMAWEIAFGIVSFLVPLLQTLVIFALVPLLIQDEPLVGTTAFWFTRPIGRRDLLQAKALFALGLLVLLPLAVELAVLAANRASPGQLALAVPEILLNRLGTLLMVAALAVLTPNFARFVLVAVLAFVAFIVVYFVIYIVAMFVNPMAMLRHAQEPSLQVSRSIVSGLAGVAGYAAVVVHQYLRRRTPVSAGLLAAVLAATMALSYLWRFDFMAPRVDPRLAVDYDESGARVYLDDRQLNVSDQFRMSGKENRRKSVRGQIRVEGAEPGYELRARATAATFTFDDGFQAKDPESDFDFTRRNWSAASLEHVLDGCRVITPQDTVYFNRSALFSLSEAEFQARRDQAGDLKADVAVDVYQYVPAGSVPLKAGERIDLGAEQAVITDVLEESSGCAVILRERTLKLMFDRAAQRENTFAGRERNVLYVLRNRTHKEVALPDDDDDPNLRAAISGQQRLDIHSTRLRFGGGGRSGSRGSRLDKEWLAGAELVRVDAVQVDRFHKELVAEDLRLDGGDRSYSPSDMSPAEIDAALDRIAYPEEPTEESVREYIRAIREATAGQHSWSPDDRQVAMLQKVGPEHVRLLFEEGIASYHLRYAAPPLLDESHKAWVIANLRQHPWLADVVWKNNWTAEAHDVLVRGMQEQWADLPIDWFKAVASFREPATYGGLTDYFATRRNRAQSYKVLQDLEGIDLDVAVARAWRNAKYGGDYEAREMIPIAIAHGQPDALRAGILDVLGDPEASQHVRKRVREAVTAHAGIEGTDEEITAWYRANEGRIGFDRESRRFRVGETP